MKRREFLGGLGGAVAWPLATRAQQDGRVRRVGMLYAGASEDDTERAARLEAFRQGMAKLGWVEDRNLIISIRAAGAHAEQIRVYAAELAALAPEVVVAVSNPVLAAMRRAAPETPIVFALVGDPVGSNFVASLARPAGNVTGFMHYEPAMGGKWLEMLKEIAPAMTRALVLLHLDVTANAEFLRAAEAAGRAHGVAVEAGGLRNAEDVARAVTSFASQPGGGLVVLPNPVTGQNRKTIADLAIKHRLPAIGAFRYLAAEGVLSSYGIDNADQFRRAAGYVDRILRGEKPADLPVQAPTKYNLTINVITAKALGLTIPPTLLARADEVIE